ncbi:hypothetical protein FBU30_008303 [Linnemannia zychae]|nr:hypothetical protein FBU30_008303 [Linnemannia zychae]
MAETTTQDVGLVERILEKRVDMNTGAVEYLIRWQGTDSQGNEYEDTWEPEENVLGIELIEEFEQSRPTMRVHPRQPSSTKLNGASLLQGEALKQQLSVRYPHPPLPPSVESNHQQQPRGREAYPESHPTGFYHPPWHYHRSGQYPSHQNIPTDTPPGYYLSSYASQYLPTHRQPPFHGPSSAQHYPLHLSSGRGREKQLSGRERSIAYVTNSSKRKASSSVIDDSDSKDMSGVESTANAESSKLQQPRETDKRLKAEHELRSNSRLSKYISKRQTGGFNGKLSMSIRLLQLDHDREKAYFKLVIEKSELIKDLAFRLEAGATLLTSDMWLIEVKEQQETPGSLFLAFDVPNAVAKALFIPEMILKYQRKQHPGKSLVLNDRSIVSAIIAGDICERDTNQYVTTVGFGLLPSTNTELGTTKSPIQQSDSSEHALDQTIKADSNSDFSMDIDEPAVKSTINCGWKDCSETRSTMKELALHVQKEHLQVLELGISAASTEPAHNGSGSPRVITPQESGAEKSIDTIRDDRIQELQNSYSSLKRDLIKMKEEIAESDQQAHNLSILYSTAIETSEENIKRLEAQLEWEMKKWDQYLEETRRMAALNGSGDSVLEHQSPVVTNDKITGSVPEQAIGMDIGLQVQDDSEFDKPMIAQAQNSILKIQKLLLAAREKQSQLEKQNQELVDKRRALESEHALLDQRYQETLTQLASLEAKDQSTTEAVKSRLKGVELCRTMMDQDQEHSRKIMEQLQSKIDILRQDTSPSSAISGQLSSLANTMAKDTVQVGDANSDHIMTDVISQAATETSTVLKSEETPSDIPSPMSVEPEQPAALDLTSEQMTSMPLDVQSSVDGPPTQPTAPSNSFETTQSDQQLVITTTGNAEPHISDNLGTSPSAAIISSSATGLAATAAIESDSALTPVLTTTTIQAAENGASATPQNKMQETNSSLHSQPLPSSPKTSIASSNDTSVHPIATTTTVASDISNSFNDPNEVTSN